MGDKWIEIKIVTKSEAVEPVSGIFYGLDVKGVAIEDPNDIAENKRDALSWDFADTNIFEYGNTAAVVKGYFSEKEDIDEIIKYIDSKLKELEEFGIDTGEGLVLINPVYEEDWATSWKKYYKPVKLGNKIIIKPTWEEYSPKDDELIVELDPGMAFGTGTHETTMMCVGFLEKFIRQGDIVFDIGTGSGILSIVSSKLGAEKTIGVDLDEVAVKAARDNVKVNAVDNVDILYGNLVDVIEGRADIIVANIIADVIISLSRIVKPYMKEDALFITSGIIRERKDDVLSSLTTEGFEIADIKEMGEWVAIVSKIK